MKKSLPYLSFVLGLIISFPLLFQSYHAIDHHILEDDIHVSCCAHEEQDSANNGEKSYSFVDSEIELCPICEYQMVYFLDEKQELPEQNIEFVLDIKTSILEHPVVEYKDFKNLLRGPPSI